MPGIADPVCDDAVSSTALALQWPMGVGSDGQTVEETPTADPADFVRFSRSATGVAFRVLAGADAGFLRAGFFGVTLDLGGVGSCDIAMPGIVIPRMSCICALTGVVVAGVITAVARSRGSIFMPPLPSRVRGTPLRDAP
ncbi:hypothetical protein [Sphingomonas faeni]|uniref:hypothetical protein n=1 Tax=Sphingomonas faeni TaxID=185950 RepID=UPI00334A26C3